MIKRKADFVKVVVTEKVILDKIFYCLTIEMR